MSRMIFVFGHAARGLMQDVLVKLELELVKVCGIDVPLAIILRAAVVASVAARRLLVLSD